MRYRIRNHTDLPDREVRRLIKLAGADLDFTRGVVWIDVRWTRPHHDRKNPYAASGHCEWNGVEVSLRIAKPESYPCTIYERAYTGHVIGPINDWREALVVIAAHELKHAAEIQRGCRSRHRLMEGRCDAYAYSRLMFYRDTRESFA